MKYLFKELKHDLLKSIVIFFVAVSRCLSIALASRATFFPGIISLTVQKQRTKTRKGRVGVRIGFITISLLLSFYQLSYGQDSTKTFSQENLFWYLVNYHPISKQASIQIKKGENEVRKIKGQLDPSLFSNLNQKQFNQQEYYSLFSGGLRVPTWYAVDFKVGYEQNQGVNVNPENKTTANGLFYAGFSVPIGQGLFIDKRRASIKQAELYAESTYLQQELMLNTLYYDATIKYIDWVNYFNQMKLYQNALALANDRFEGVKKSFVGGDVPAIDTLEAFILVQVREVNLNQAKLNYQNATLELSNFLWFENNTPLEITAQLTPPTIDQLPPHKSLTTDTLNSILNNLKITHPQLLWYDLKVQQLEVEQRWNQEQLKPTLNLKYNLLNEPIGGDAFSGFSPNNYTFGIDFSMPLFLRESRGRLNITKLNIQDTKLEVDLKYLELSNKVTSYHNEILAVEQQIQLFNTIVLNYFNLLEAEKQKFFMGESSMFLINSREASYVQAAIKLIELNIKYQSAIAEFKFATATW
ncbi:MAG: TolC family protein [Bacteroidia bacterium]